MFTGLQIAKKWAIFREVKWNDWQQSDTLKIASIKSYRYIVINEDPLKTCKW